MIGSTFGLSAETLQKIKGVLSNFPQIEKVVIYGSRALGTERHGSDIDLTFFGKDLILETLFKIGNDLDNLSLPYKFDLSLIDTIENKDLIEHISSNGKVFYTR